VHCFIGFPGEVVGFCIPGVNFINVLQAAFYTRRSQKCKKLLDLTVFFALLGSACIKAACKHIGEIDTSYKLLLPLMQVLIDLKTNKTQMETKTENDFEKTITMKNETKEMKE